MSTLLFVYGTLKRGGRNARLMEGQRFVGEARTAPGFRLYRVGEYPGMVPLAEDRDGVTGEVWQVDAATLEKLDEFEGVHEGLFRRERVRLLPPFENRIIEAYVYVRSVAGCADVGGAWKL
jgi:gamma-glutamylaminecyclotransferase